MTVAMNERGKIISTWIKRTEEIGRDTIWTNGPAFVKAYNGDLGGKRLGIVIGTGELEFLVNSKGVIGSRPVIVDFVESKYAVCPEAGHKLRSRSKTASDLRSVKREDPAVYNTLDDDIKYLLFG